MFIRKAAVTGTWYPGSAQALTAAVDRYLDAADATACGLTSVVAVIAPHAGLTYSGPVAAHAYRQLRRQIIDLAILVGPSHFVGFDGVAVCARGVFETPLGGAEIDDACAADLLAQTPVIHDDSRPHVREHSLEMQLPFLQRIAPQAKIVPLLMGFQTGATARALGDALATVLPGRNAILVASTDLSHYYDARTAAVLDGVVIDHLSRLDADGLQQRLDAQPEHACGGGPMVAVLRAARRLGADEAVILNYADSGDVSGDKTSVVGYVSAALGRR